MIFSNENETFINISGISLLLTSIIAYQFGRWITRKISVLNEYHIPATVTGGLLFSVLFLLLSDWLNVKITWGLELRDQFLLIFFCTVGLGARFNLLRSGGKTLVTLFFVMALFLVAQNFVGIMTAIAIGETPIHGLLAGSISMAGGHGTAISWGAFLESAGYQGASEFGLVAATMGLIMGGLVGGPVAHALVKKHNLCPSQANLSDHSNPSKVSEQRMSLSMQEALRVIAVICGCIIVGVWINSYFRAQGIVMPNYLPVLFIAIIVVNLTDRCQIRLNDRFIDLFSGICLEIFITMSLISLNLTQLAQTALPALLIVLAQAVFIAFFAYFIMFRASGKDYDASLITSGFVGLGLGATPVGLANVSTLTQRYGVSPKAFLIVPLLGSVFTDTLNAAVLQLFLSIPFIYP
ncbi:sodium/glutamate symporter [Endozoicomonas sp. (ex Bugula neritina AB1)]|nr:sodium/glutamate symporter [Endozoicomonas sp. (ex Bugula neritina AB1)]